MEAMLTKLKDRHVITLTNEGYFVARTITDKFVITEGWRDEVKRSVLIIPTNNPRFVTAKLYLDRWFVQDEEGRVLASSDSQWHYP